MKNKESITCPLTDDDQDDLRRKDLPDVELKPILKDILNKKDEAIRPELFDEHMEKLRDEHLITKWDLKKINEIMEECKKRGFKEDDLNYVREMFVRDAIASSRDGLVPNLANFSLLKSRLYGSIDDSMEIYRTGDSDIFKKTAMIFFDLDGLKSINDNALGGHEKGDEYIRLAGDVLINGRTTKWLEERGFKVTPSRRSGDEFMYVIETDLVMDEKCDFKGIDGENVENKKRMDYIMKKLQEDFENDERFSKLQDFSDEKQRAAYKRDFEAKGMEIPKDLKFKASISGGWASFRNALSSLKDAINDPEKIYKEVVMMILGEMIEVADEKMTINKNKKKIARSNGTDQEKALEVIYRAGRGSEEEYIKDELARMFDKILQNLEEPMDKEMSEAEDKDKDPKETIERIRKILNFIKKSREFIKTLQKINEKK